MKKLNAILVTLILVVILGVSVFADDLNVFNFTTKTTKEIRTTDVYYVDGVQVTKSEYDTAVAKGDTVEYVDMCSKYCLTRETVYKINGSVVTENEYNAMLANAGSSTPTTTPTKSSSTKTVVITDLSSAYNVGELSDYLTFTVDTYNANLVVKAVVKSDKVQSISYDYSNGYMSFFDTADMYCYGGNGCVYQKTDGSFTIGGVPNSTYKLVKEKTDVSVGTVVFNIIENDNFSTISFSDLFKSITLTVTD